MTNVISDGALGSLPLPPTPNPLKTLDSEKNLPLFFPEIFLGLLGFILYYCGLTRAKNCGHTVTALFLGFILAILGFWISGFAVQSGGIGDEHSNLQNTITADEKLTLNHELGFSSNNHFLGFMGSAAYFLSLTDIAHRQATLHLFLIQSSLVALTVLSFLGVGLERAKLLALSIVALLASAVIYPIYANWVWGSGWLAQLGTFAQEHGFNLGHGFIDLSGSGVIHVTAATMGLALAMILGPRYGRFNRDDSANSIPGHNLPFVVYGTFLIMISLFNFNHISTAILLDNPSALTTVNCLLSAIGSVLSTLFWNSIFRLKPDPTALCRGLIGGIVACSASSALIEPWSAFVIGLIAGLLIALGYRYVERVLNIDDPVGVIAVQGAGGVWGLLALGLFANNNEIQNLNQIGGPVQGWLYSGQWQQFLAQSIGCVTGFTVVFLLSYTLFLIADKVIGLRVEISQEVEGLDATLMGTQGYQPDADPESS